MNLQYGILNKPLALLPLLLDLLHQIIIKLRLQVPEAQVLQLPLDIGNTQAVGKGRIHLDGFLGNALLLFFLDEFQGAHVVQPVSQLNHDYPDVLGHGQKQLAVILRLLLLPGLVLDFPQLGDAINQHRHLGAENILHLGLRISRILHHIMEKRRRDGGTVNLQLRKDFCHAQGMDDISSPEARF